MEHDQLAHHAHSHRKKHPVGRGYTGSQHAVQFYSNVRFLAAVVADFLAEGIALGDRVLVVATAEHRKAFWEALEAKGVDVAHVSSTGQLSAVDAHDTLSTFMIDGVFDRERFNATAQLLVQRNRWGRETSRFRAYGEMVDILWQTGKVDQALHLEQLWNELAEVSTFTLLCGYRTLEFRDAAQTKQFLSVCNLHQRVLPAEGAMANTVDLPR